MMVWLNNWLEEVLDNKIRPFLEEKDLLNDNKNPDKKAVAENEENEWLYGEIEKARRQWVNCHKYFHSVSDPELIDHASYKIQAARAKYMYLLNKARSREEDNQKNG